MQHIEDNTEQDTETNTEQYTNTSTENSTENNAQPQHTCTHYLHTYSFDLYHEQIYIKNSNTIELYTILK